MEGSKQPTGVYKGRYIDYRTKHHRVRCSDPQSYLGDEDTLEDSLRHLDSVKTARAEQRARTQPRGLGKDTREEQD